MKRGFTLAEVLITLGIIGVVAALTIPGLMKKIDERVTSTQKTVMERKLLQGLNMMSNRENGLNVTYNNTEEFVRALSKYLKIITICSKDELNKCMPYDKIAYDSNGQLKTVDVINLSSASSMKLEGNWLDPAGFIMADGTPFIISYNNDCGSLTDSKGNTIVDPDKPMKDFPTGCIDGLYDNNGSRTPNKFGKDVQPFFAAKVGSSCLLEVNNKCLISTPAFTPTPMSKEECLANKAKYGINNCDYDNDYWAGAMKACQDQGMRLPNGDELAQIASYVYNTNVNRNGETSGLTLDHSRVPESLTGLGSSTTLLYELAEGSGPHQWSRVFENSKTKVYNYHVRDQHFSGYKTICVEK